MGSFLNCITIRGGAYVTVSVLHYVRVDDVLKFAGSETLRRIVVLNPKGGSGKTTLAFNLAGYLASTGRKVAIVDMDRQGSSTRWLHNRASGLPWILGISAADTQHVVVPPDIECAVIDAPAGLPGDQLIDLTCGTHAIFVPVLPSDLDIHAASRLISDLLLKAQVSRREGRLGIVANRVKANTIAYQQLARFLNRLSIPVVGLIRDSQNYARAASSGLCIHEMPPSRAGKDLAQWEAVTRWLESRLTKPLTPRDLLRPTEKTTPDRPRQLRPTMWVRAAAAAILAVSLGLWSVVRDLHDASSVEQSATPVFEPAAPAEHDIVELPDRSLAVGEGAMLKQKWRLSGVMRWDGSSRLIVEDRGEHTSRQISEDVDLDGWIVTDTGRNYAVFAQNGEEVRLVLNEDIEH